ncbi:hypothetical protein [Brevibacterium album]|uniref:hypothetical protein n=1 Tax=Brevibacterium album TaxID=417948 RepID=UPI00041B71DF|nr:hypothetical protein [Brevibacterium album]
MGISRLPAACAAGAAALVLAACSGSGEGEGPSEAARAETSAAAEADGAEQAGGGTPGEPLQITAHGEGPIGLTAPGTAEEAGKAAEYTGKLITGPGGCLAVTEAAASGESREQRPELVIFPEAAEFTLRGERPGVTADELGTVRVGEQIAFESRTVPRSEVAGVPERCAHGGAETMRVVLG